MELTRRVKSFYQVFSKIYYVLYNVLCAEGSKIWFLTNLLRRKASDFTNQKRSGCPKVGCMEQARGIGGGFTELLVLEKQRSRKGTT